MTLPGTPLDRLAPGLAVPRDAVAGYGDGLDRAVSLGGGGLFFVPWQIGYLHGLAARMTVNAPRGQHRTDAGVPRHPISKADSIT
ncbi:MAG TPA: hypothetical protein VFC16_16540 [Nakamurella sp.]|nr:hypothetical protein [Nakamurella sp.]